MNPNIYSFPYGQHMVTLETGIIARQADASVLVSMGDTTVLVAVVGNKEAKAGQDFFPLTVNYQEKAYAAGKIPGGFFKREGRPSENETLVSRLIDRPIRPLFPKGFVNEVQVVATLVSLDPNISADIVAMIGVSAALSISGLPFNGPIGAARVAYINDNYVLNPTPTELKQSQLDLVVSGTKNAILMVESEADCLPESVMLGAVMFGHQAQQAIIDGIVAFKAEVNNSEWDWTKPSENTMLMEEITNLAHAGLSEAYLITEKLARYEAIGKVKEQVVTAIELKNPEQDRVEVENLLGRLEKSIVRQRILQNQPRIDGRDSKMVRALSILPTVLPRTHGSSLFTRGETQALVTVTLGTERDAQIIDELSGEITDRFMLHYNFPAYSVGEIGMSLSPKRREIGHGKLAKRGIQAVMPSKEDFQYTVRVVSEITESNGSSSMASVCGASLALMDAGVPIKSAVAGIAMGLVKEGDDFVVLSDILGDEDHLGDMDFKVAGTFDGITALQMDIKIEGITEDIMKIALSQAYEARIHILKVMNEAIDSPRAEMSPFAPRITTLKISPDKIKDVIGKGGSTIKSITEEIGTTIEIEQDGTIKISSTSEEATNKTIARIEEITQDLEEGKVYKGTVNRLADFGAFVSISPSKDGLLHISQICDERINAVSDKLQLGQEVMVRVVEIDRQGRIRLSMKGVATQ